MSLKEKLRKTTDILLDENEGYACWRNACMDLEQLFKEASGFDDDTFKNTPHLTTAGGLAISPFSAAYCIIDFMRTCKFLQGIKAAIEDKLKANPGRPVTIMYAGTGPFATLLTPFTTIYLPNQIQFVFFEIHPETEKYLTNTIKAFELQPYILDIVHEDAATYIIPAKNKPDIIVSETMKPALEKEPQVSIMSNLLAQSEKETLIIPEEIIIEAALTGNMSNPSNKTVPLQTLMKFNRQYIEEFTKTSIHPETILEIPHINDASITQVALCTTILVYNSYFIKKGESSLTINKRLCDTGVFNGKAVAYRVVYTAGEKPGFVFSRLY